LASKNVLIVDDEEDLTWSIAKHLSKDKERYDLYAVNSGADALLKLQETDIDLVVTDIRMPEISGLDLLMKVREFYPQTKVIIMTAYGSSEIQEEANKRGCFKYIEKPFEISQLRQMILDGVEEKRGFEGRISDFQLSDLIQMNCLGRLTNAITVQTNEKSGIIYFEDGNIVHAQVGKDVGEEAFYEIISWEGGRFEIRRGAKADQESIIKGWQSLVLEGMRRADESRRKARESSANAAKLRPERIKKLLDEFVHTKGVRILVFFTNDVKPLVTVAGADFEDRYNTQELTAEVNNLLQQEKGLARSAVMSIKKEMTVEYAEGVIKLTWLPGKKGFLLLIADQTSNFGLLRIETKKYLKALTEIL